MFDYKKNQRLKNLYAMVFAFSFSLAACFTMFVCIEFNIWGFLVTILLWVLMAFSIFMLSITNKFYRLKYYFLGKKFDELIENSAKKFVNADPQFIEEFRKSKIADYRQSGKIFYESNVSQDAWIYRNEKQLKMVEKLFNILAKSIKSKGGFTEFCRELRKFDVDDEYMILNYLNTGLVSNELKYLFSAVFNYSYFWVEDTGISPEYTEKNKETIKKLDEYYSPILFGFEDEINAIIKKIKDNFKNIKTSE